MAVEMTDSELYYEEGLVLSDSAKMWRNEVNKYPLLTSEEEVEVGKCLKKNKGILFNGCYLDIDKVFILLCSNNHSNDILNILYSLFSSECNKGILNKLDRYFSIKNRLGRCLNREELFKYFKINGDYSLDDNLLLKDINDYVRYMNSRDKMICSNLRLVGGIAGSYSSKFEIEFMDLVSEGTIGLIKAVDRFDVDKGFKLSTFATWWIKQGIRRYISNNYSDLKIPTGFYSEAKEFRNLVSRLEEEQGRQLTIDEVCSLTGVSREDAMDMLFYKVKNVSLDMPVNDEEDASLGDFIPSNDEEIDKDIQRKELNRLVKDALEVLSDDERIAIMLLFGIDRDEACSVYEVSRIMKKPTAKINFYVKNGLQKLRLFSKRKEEVRKLELYL